MNDNNDKKKDLAPRTPESEAFNLAQREAQAWASSSIIPEVYRGNVSNVLIAMEIAKRIGASVLAVMQNLHIIKGKPTFSASFLIATVNGSGRFTPIRYRMEGTQGKDDWGCRAYATDKESKEECLGPAITVAMAKGEGWWSKKDNQGRECSKWQTMPELMLCYRAAAFWTRVYCPELSMGMHTAEEMEDVETVRADPAEVVSPMEALTDELQKEAEDKAGAATPDTDTDGKPNNNADTDDAKQPETTPDPPEPEKSSRESERGLQGEIERFAKLIYGADWLDGIEALCDANTVNMQNMGAEGEKKIFELLKEQLEAK